VTIASLEIAVRADPGTSTYAGALSDPLSLLGEHVPGWVQPRIELYDKVPARSALVYLDGSL
jgi:hypothetical protein